MPSPKSKTKPVLSMSRPKIDPAAAEAFVRGAGGAAVETPAPAPKAESVPAPEPTPTPAPKLVEVVSAPEVEDEPVQVAAPQVEEKPQADESKAPRKAKAKAKKEPRESKTVGRGIVTRSTGRQVRRRVVYLPPGLDKKLAIAAAMRGEDVSEVVASLLHEHL